jgi:hypothetical protein
MGKIGEEFVIILDIEHVLSIDELSMLSGFDDAEKMGVLEDTALLEQKKESESEESEESKSKSKSKESDDEESDSVQASEKNISTDENTPDEKQVDD